MSKCNGSYRFCFFSRQYYVFDLNYLLFTTVKIRLSVLLSVNFGFIVAFQFII